MAAVRISRQSVTGAFAIVLTLSVAGSLGWSQEPAGGGEGGTTVVGDRSAPSSRTIDNTDGAVDETPRQRRRVLEKRNPLATEYQSIGDIGSIALSDLDSEGVDHRAAFSLDDPFEGPDRKVSGEVSYNYSKLSGRGEWQGKGSFQQRLGTLRRWSLSIEAERTGVDQVFEKTDYRWRLREFEGESHFLAHFVQLAHNSVTTVRNRARISLQRLLGEHHRVYLKTGYEDRKDEVTDQRLNMRIGVGEILSLTPRSGTTRNADAERTVRHGVDQRNRWRLLAGGEQSGDTGGVDYSFYYSRWELKQPDDINPIFRVDGVDYEYSVGNVAFPEVTVLNGVDLNDAENFAFSESDERNIVTTDTDYAGQFNFHRRFNLGTFPIELKTGAVYRTKERTNLDRRVALDGYNGQFFLDRASAPEPGKIVRDTYRPGPPVDTAAFREFTENGRGNIVFNNGRARSEADPNNYRASEGVFGLYFLQSLSGTNWKLRGGLRFERTELETNGNVVLTDSAGDYLRTDAVSASNKYNRWFPSIRFDYRFNDGARLWAAWSRTLARPDYFDLVPFRRIVTNAEFISEGNPGLRPTEFANFVIGLDLRNEAFGELSIVGYHKDLKAFFFDSEAIVAGGAFDGWDRSRRENGDAAVVWGFEVAWNRKIEIFSSKLGEVSLEAFYTHSESTAEVSVRPGEELRLPERSRHFGSITATHRAGPLETVVGVKYQSRFLERINTEVRLDEYLDESVKLDLALNLRTAPGVKSFLRFSNLLDWPQRPFEGDLSRLTENEYGSWKLEAGVSFRK